MTRLRFAIPTLALLVSTALPAAAAEPPRDAPLPTKKGNARIGFQMHLVPMTMLSVPLGDATDAPGDSMSSRYSWQWVPFDIGLGAKITPEIYLGAYMNVGVGYEGSDLHTEDRCEAGNDVDDDVSCSSVNIHGGIELRYSFMPAERMNAWAGYGIGVASASQTISDAGRYSETSTAQGIDWARLSGGLDFRFSRGFGMGPVAYASVGRYIHRRTEIAKRVTFSGEIEEPALHLWASVGLRLVFFP